jgi:hypothetical protein
MFLKEKWMYNIETDENVCSFQLDNNLSYLCILNVKSIPPHISFICNGLYFSYSVYGVKLAANAQARIDVFSKKLIPTVLIALETKISLIDVNNEYSKHKELKINSSCLDPIKQLLLPKDLINLNNPFYLFDLLDCIKKNNLIKSTISINCKDVLNDKNTIILQKYTQKEIDSQIIKVLNLKK